MMELMLPYVRESSPSVVFGVKKKIGTDNSDTNSDYDHDEEDKHHESKHVVHLVLPE